MARGSANFFNGIRTRYLLSQRTAKTLRRNNFLLKFQTPVPAAALTPSRSLDDFINLESARYGRLPVTIFHINCWYNVTATASYISNVVLYIRAPYNIDSVSFQTTKKWCLIPVLKEYFQWTFYVEEAILY